MLTVIRRYSLLMSLVVGVVGGWWECHGLPEGWAGEITQGPGGFSEGPGEFVELRPLTEAERRAALKRAAEWKAPPRMAPKIRPKYAPGVDKYAPGVESSAAELSLRPALAPPVTVSFRGVDQSNLGTPADPILAAGPNHVVQTVNSLIRITNKTGGNPVDVDPALVFATFFAQNPNASVAFDPWIVYDHFDNRFAMVWLSFTPNFAQSFFLIAVSTGSDPTLGLNVFVQRADLDNSTDTAFWADYEKLGFDNQNYYITSNQFDAQGNFQYAKIRVMQKAQFYNPLNTPRFYDLININDATGQLAFTIQPCVTFGTPGREYLVSGEFGGGNRLTLYSITGSWPNPFNTPPTLTNEGAVNFTPWFFPPTGVARDSSQPVDVGDDRLLNAVFRNNVVYTAHSMATSSLLCAAGVKSINVQTRTRVLDVALGAPGEYWCWPAVTADPSNNVAVVFNRLSPTVWIEVAYTMKGATEPTFQPFTTLKAGTGGYEGFRLGDYNGMCIDPSNGAFWFNGMWATGAPGAFGPETGYGTWVGSFRAPTSGGGGAVPNDLTVTYNSGTQTLTFTGDDLPNSFSVTRQGGKVTINGGNGTRINGANTASFNVGNGPINISGNLNGGNDTASLISLNIATINWNLGPGNDRVVMNYCTVQTSQMNGGPGADSLITTTSKITTNLNVSIP